MSKQIIAFICVFAYYASPYRLVGVELPELLLVSTVFLQLFLSKNYTKIYLPKEYWCFMAYMWIIPPITSEIVGHPCSIAESLVPVALILYSLYLALILPNIDYVLVVKYYKRLVYIAISFFLIQELCVNLIEFRPTLYLNFLDSYYVEGTTSDLSISHLEMSRSSSFFLEPSHFVQYIIPYVCIVVSDSFKNRKFTIELLTLVVIVLWARSGVGYLELFVIFVFLFIAYWRKPIMIKAIVACLTGFLVVLITKYFGNNPFIANILKRTNEFSLTVDYTGAQSGFIRIWRGYFIYLSGEIINIIFGTANAAIEYVSMKIFIPGVRYQGVYLNGVQSLLVGGGAVGTLLFLTYIKRIYKTFSMSGKSIIVAMICCFFMEHMLFTPKMFLYILVSYSVSRLENNNFKKVM